MQIVIDLSEQDYELACKYPDALIGVYAHAIKNGTPLPKGHGRLIDADALVGLWEGAEMRGSIKPIIDARQTIIEEDKSGRDGET